jgi:hypothetical protein
MPTPRPRALANARRALTREGYQDALKAILRHGPDAAPIPDASSDDQAFLEARFLEELGRCRYDRCRTPLVPFMLNSVTPEPDELTIRVPDRYLPDVIRDVMPYGTVGSDGRLPDIGGIAGLRYRHERGRAVLFRPGRQGQVSVPASKSMWESACHVAIDTQDSDRQLYFPWLSSPGNWDSAEKVPWILSGEKNRGSNMFMSQVLRRLPGLCPPPRAEYYDLWTNYRHGNECVVKLEWMNGAGHSKIMVNLLSPRLNPVMEITPEGKWNIGKDDFPVETGGSATLRSKKYPGSMIVLRRMADARWAHEDENAGDTYPASRLAIEERHGYRTRCPQRLRGR